MEQHDRQRSSLSPRAIGAIVLAVLALIFVFQNTRTGRVNLLFWDIRAPAWLWLVVLFGAGVVVGSLFPWFRRREHRQAITALVRSQESRTELSSAWSIGDNLNGGYVLSSVLRAMSLMTEHADPLSATAHFLRPVRGGPAEIATTVHHSGRTTSVLSGRLTAEESDRVHVHAVFGRLDDNDAPAAIAPRPPDLPDPDACVDRRELAQGIDLALLQRIDVRVDPRESATGSAVMQGWVRFVDESEPSPLALALFADAFPPALVATVDQLGWVPTIELTVHVRGRPAPGWVRARFECDDLVAGRMIESGTLWDSTGSVVARSRQLGLVRFSAH